MGLIQQDIQTFVISSIFADAPEKRCTNSVNRLDEICNYLVYFHCHFLGLTTTQKDVLGVRILVNTLTEPTISDNAIKSRVQRLADISSDFIIAGLKLRENWTGNWFYNIFMCVSDPTCQLNQIMSVLSKFQTKFPDTWMSKLLPCYIHPACDFKNDNTWTIV